MHRLNEAQFWNYYSTFSRLTKTIPQMMTELQSLSQDEFETHWETVKNILLSTFNVKVFEAMSEFLMEKASPVGNQREISAKGEQPVSIFGQVFKIHEGKVDKKWGKGQILIDSTGGYACTTEIDGEKYKSVYTKTMDYAEVIRGGLPFPSDIAGIQIGYRQRILENGQSTQAFEGVLDAYGELVESQKNFVKNASLSSEHRSLFKDTFLIQHIIDFRARSIAILRFVGNIFETYENHLGALETARQSIFGQLRTICTLFTALNMLLVDVVMALTADREADRLLNLPHSSELNASEESFYSLAAHASSVIVENKSDISAICLGKLKEQFTLSHVSINLQKYFRGKTLLHIAVERGFVSLVQWLLEQGLDPMLLDDQYETAIEKASNKLQDDTLEGETSKAIIAVFDAYYQAQLEQKKMIFEGIDTQHRRACNQAKSLEALHQYAQARKNSLIDKQQLAFLNGMHHWFYYQRPENRLHIQNEATLRKILSFFAQAISDDPPYEQAVINLSVLSSKYAGDEAFPALFRSILGEALRSKFRQEETKLHLILSTQTFPLPRVTKLRDVEITSHLKGLKAAVIGGAREQGELGNFLYGKLQKESGVFWLLQSAIEGYPPAIIKLGDIYLIERETGEHFLKKAHLLKLLDTLIHDKAFIQNKSRYYHLREDEIAECQQQAKARLEEIVKGNRHIKALKAEVEQLKAQFIEAEAADVDVVMTGAMNIIKIICHFLTGEKKNAALPASLTTEGSPASLEREQEIAYTGYRDGSHIDEDRKALDALFIKVKEMCGVSCDAWYDLHEAFSLDSNAPLVKNRSDFSKKTVGFEDKTVDFLKTIQGLVDENVKRETVFYAQLEQHMSKFGNARVNDFLETLETHGQHLAHATQFLKAMLTLLSEEMKNITAEGVLQMLESTGKTMEDPNISDALKEQAYDALMDVTDKYIAGQLAQPFSADFAALITVQERQHAFEMHYKKQSTSAIRLNKMRAKWESMKPSAEMFPDEVGFNLDLAKLVEETQEESARGKARVQAIEEQLTQPNLSAREQTALRNEKMKLEGDLASLAGLSQKMTEVMIARRIKKHASRYQPSVSSAPNPEVPSPQAQQKSLQTMGGSALGKKSKNLSHSQNNNNNNNHDAHTHGEENNALLGKSTPPKSKSARLGSFLSKKASPMPKQDGKASEKKPALPVVIRVSEVKETFFKQETASVPLVSAISPEVSTASPSIKQRQAMLSGLQFVLPAAQPRRNQ